MMKVDLVGPMRRGSALGINEFAGYLAVGFTAWITGYLAAEYVLRPQLFYLGIAVAIAGLLLSVFEARETIDHARLSGLQAAIRMLETLVRGPATGFEVSRF